MHLSIKKIQGYPVIVEDNPVGEINTVFFSKKEWLVRYFVITLHHLIGNKDILIPPEKFTLSESQVAFTLKDMDKEKLENSPTVDPEKEIESSHEKDLISYWGWPPYWGNEAMFSEPPLYEEESGKKSAFAKYPRLINANHLKEYKIFAKDSYFSTVNDFIISDNGWEVLYIITALEKDKMIKIKPEWIIEASPQEKKLVVNLSREVLEYAPHYDPELIFNPDLDD